MESKLNPPILEKLDDMYDDEKTKKFIVHLIRAYLPLHKPHYIVDWQRGQKHKCTICKCQLISYGEFFLKFAEKESFQDFKEYIKAHVEAKEHEHPFAKLFDNKVLAFAGEKTNTCMCFNCVRELLSFTQSKVLQQDKHINWVIRNMVIPGINDKKKDGITDKKYKFDPQNNLKPYYVDEGKGMTLGDIPGFEKLKTM